MPLHQERDIEDLISHVGEIKSSSLNKNCKNCKELFTLKYFRKITKGTKIYYSGKCRKCRGGDNKTSRLLNPNSVKKYTQKRIAKLSQQRRDGIDTEKFLLGDCKRTDRTKGLENDLTLGFIKNLISKGCQYCKTFEGRINLDRINNLLGHTQDNVVSSCLRCNLTRGGMPYEAWLEIAPAMAQARIENLFSGWQYGKFDFSR